MRRASDWTMPACSRKQAAISSRMTLALQALVALAKVDGGPVDELEAELHELRERLGIVALPPLPLGSRPSALP